MYFFQCPFQDIITSTVFQLSEFLSVCVCVFHVPSVTAANLMVLTTKVLVDLTRRFISTIIVHVSSSISQLCVFLTCTRVCDFSGLTVCVCVCFQGHSSTVGCIPPSTAGVELKVMNLSPFYLLTLNTACEVMDCFLAQVHSSLFSSFHHS